MILFMTVYMAYIYFFSHGNYLLYYFRYNLRSLLIHNMGQQ